MNGRRAQIAVIGLLVAHGLTFSGFSQSTAKDLSKEDALELALIQNFGIQLAQKKAQSAGVNTGWGAAGALPQIGVTATVSNMVSDQSENPTSFIQEKLESESLNATAQFNWTIFDGMRMFANKQALDVMAEQAEGQLYLVIEQTVVAVLGAYDEVLIQRAMETVLRNSLTVSAERLIRLETAQEFGGARTFDRLQIQNSLFTDSLALIQQGLARETALQNFNRLLGVEESERWRLTSELEEPKTPDSWETLKSGILNDATAIRNALLSYELASVGLEQAQGGLYPTLQVSSNVGDQRSVFAAGDLSGAGRTLNLAANLTLNFNVFNGGATRRAIQQAKIEIEVAALDFADQQNQMVVFARTAVDRMNAQESMYGLAVRMADNARSLLTMGMDRLEFGAINSLDFRELQLSVQRAEMEVLRTQQGWGSAHLDLKRLQGFWGGGIDNE